MLTAAIIGCSAISFSGALLLVPVQLTIMTRLHKLLGQSLSASTGESFIKELAVVAAVITESLGWIRGKMLTDGKDIFDQAMFF